MKKLLIAAAFSTTLAASSAMANPVNKADLDQLFVNEGNTAAHVALLSKQEMGATEGSGRLTPVWNGIKWVWNATGAALTAKEVYDYFFGKKK